MACTSACVGVAPMPSFCTSAVSPIETAKRAAARRAVDQYVSSGQVVGIGSGSTITYAVERLGELRSQGQKVVCVPTSFQAEQLIVMHGLTMGTLSTHPDLDVAIDGADEVSRELDLIKGGGGCQTQEKVVASCAKRFVVVADYRKQAQLLGQEWKKGVPIEVVPFSYVPVMKKIERLGGKPTLRMATAKAGPVVTDNGNFIIDAEFGEIREPSHLNTALHLIPGVVETGLFPGMAEKAYFGQADGSVVEWSRK